MPAWLGAPSSRVERGLIGWGPEKGIGEWTRCGSDSFGEFGSHGALSQLLGRTGTRRNLEACPCPREGGFGICFDRDPAET